MDRYQGLKLMAGVAAPPLSSSSRSLVKALDVLPRHPRK